MERLINLGVNVVNISIKEAIALGLGRVEISLGKEKEYKDKLRKFIENVNDAEILKIPYSIHLPVYIEDWYPYDYFSAFFIDEDEKKREISFKLLEHNLQNLKKYSADYYVLHFPGISAKWSNTKKFNDTLKYSLNQLNTIAEKYKVKINLEYFGSNKNFFDYNDWINTIKNYKNLGILLDTGHLYFASLMNNFDFTKALKALASSSDAFHIWTVIGDGVYSQSKSYQKYHHIAPHLEQLKKNGWAFDTKKVVEIIAKENKPVIIEPSIKYKGIDYLIKGINSIKKFFTV
ncbi:Sugar phosphate isomerase/epimerase [Caminicella sporogenes DSM 14501]|uniref:Sugar phosphate isomerase/epimerase n=1 Tax=Caminicella sporogenes DSM 14501 TaxID=1121266 RepID=A0A1M6T4L9_9FIRM|nr:TIM barrel protein [Caminicella sporogenes]RKD25483.1 hypothetical protein BET04_11150 [Caminicella sporogenes]SHK51864.1 Sugar phosphate isomerase/epimerase [Caminicella sporogenes DSM 14501]